MWQTWPGGLQCSKFGLNHVSFQAEVAPLGHLPPRHHLLHSLACCAHGGKKYKIILVRVGQNMPESTPTTNLAVFIYKMGLLQESPA